MGNHTCVILYKTIFRLQPDAISGVKTVVYDGSVTLGNRVTGENGLVEK